MPNSKPLVSIVMGSDSDLPTMQGATEALKKLGVSYEIRILSAHRTPDESSKYAKGLRKRGVRVVIAGAGGAAHLGGVIAAHTELPVIGVPISSSAMNGIDSLYAIVQMPSGIPVATVAIDGAYNAGILAAQIVGGSSLNAVRKFKDELRRKVLAKKIPHGT